MEKIIQFEIKNCPIKSQNGIYYFHDTNGIYFTQIRRNAFIHKTKEELCCTLKWIKNICDNTTFFDIVNVKIIDN